MTSQQNLIFYQLIITAMMVGVIWTVQLVIYPLFSAYQNHHHTKEENSKEELGWLHTQYTPKISYVVIPLMFSELFFGLYHTYRFPSFFAFIGLALIAGNWLCTFFLSVPLHQKVADSHDLKAAHRLVVTNWPRTILWSGRCLFLAYWLVSLQ